MLDRAASTLNIKLFGWSTTYFDTLTVDHLIVPGLAKSSRIVMILCVTIRSCCYLDGEYSLYDRIYCIVLHKAETLESYFRQKTFFLDHKER